MMFKHPYGIYTQYLPSPFIRQLLAHGRSVICEHSPKRDNPEESLQRVVRYLLHLDQTQSSELDGRAVMHQGVLFLHAADVIEVHI